MLIEVSQPLSLVRLQGVTRALDLDQFKATLACKKADQIRQSLAMADQDALKNNRQVISGNAV